MLQDIPSNVQQGVKALLEHKGRAQLLNFTFSGGGCINHGGRLTTTSGDFFLKWNNGNEFPSMFEGEAKGLQLLRNTNVIYIPEVIGVGEEEIYQFLILDYVEQRSPSATYWEDLGRQLAMLHQVTNYSYGLDHHNYIGSLRQFNNQSPSWVNFFIEQRLKIQVKRAGDAGLMDDKGKQNFEVLYAKLPSLLPEELPSLLHGDLWSGNVITNGRGDPCLIDPAVYYGNREVDLAMSRLFGGFRDEFYMAYEETFPLLPGFIERVDLYNLYPLLVHLNLFGLQYRRNIDAILTSFI